MSRPEHTSPPELFYNDKEAAKYAQSSRMMEIQTQISERALELLNLPQGQKGLMILDIGCGTGMSGSVIEEHGHVWVGSDISASMLNVASENIRAEESNGDVFVRDMGTGLGLRGGIFDGCISISAVQWLCYPSHRNHVPKIRLKRFFQDLYASLKRGSRAVIQLYPETPQQMELITHCAMAVGFGGGVVCDYPNSAKAKKFYLVLFAGPQQQSKLPEGRTEEEEQQQYYGSSSSSGQHVGVNNKRHTGFQKKKRSRKGELIATEKSRDWILQKKERQRKQGKEVRPDSKYTGRKRARKFQ